MAKGGFRGMPGGGMNQMAMMKQAQKMQQEMLRMQEELENKVFTASAGGGMVTAGVTGKHELQTLEINPEAVIIYIIWALPTMEKYQNGRRTR